MDNRAVSTKKSLSRASLFITVAFVGCSFATQDVHAQSTLIWTGANGASWSGSPSSDLNWTNNSGSAPTITNFTNGDSVIFDSNTDAANTGNRTITVNASGLSVNTMSVSGDGTYIFTGGNISSTGGVSVNNTATLLIGNGSSISKFGATINVSANAQLAFFGSSNNINIRNDLGITGITGNGTILFKGTGILGQSSYRINLASSTFAGTAIVSSGARLVLEDSGIINTNGIIVQNGGGLYMSSFNHNPIYIAGNGWTEGSGQLGAIRFDNNSEASGPVIMTANARVTSRSATATISGVISDGGNGYQLEKGDNGTIILSNNNTYRGGTSIIGGGTLRITNAGGLGIGGTVAIASGSNLEVNLSQAYTLDHTLTGAGNIKTNLGGNNAFAFSANVGSAFTGTLSLQNATFDLANTKNAAAISNATLRLGSGSKTSVVSTVAVKNLSLGAGSALAFNKGGTLALKTLSVDSGTGVTTINFTGFDTSTELYTLISFENAAPQFNAISFLTGTGAVNGYQLAFRGQSLVYTVIPEPSTYAVIAGGLALAIALVACRRRGK